MATYCHSDQKGIWVSWLGQERIGCITGVRCSAAYGFVGLCLDGSACSFGAMQWSI
jgi:hypothetical protein